MDEIFLSAIEAAEAIRKGEVTSQELVRACLQRIEEFEPSVGAWAHLDPDHALAQAKRADEYRKRGLAVGPLHGVPVGVKDIIDTGDLPTENGTVLHSGRTPGEDAFLVSRLREAGAVILGKTATTELAVYAPGQTANPHDATRTPGGSSSGSAAAVAGPPWQSAARPTARSSARRRSAAYLATSPPTAGFPVIGSSPSPGFSTPSGCSPGASGTWR
jgi:Asp-tRNA(Asn)/Glu-tRNA(Gln) amidotransferase A subunit family amidase